jgi:hypothetical protein
MELGITSYLNSNFGRNLIEFQVDFCFKFYCIWFFSICLWLLDLILVWQLTQMGLACNQAQKNLIVRKLFQFNILQVSLFVFQNMAKENIWEFFKVFENKFSKCWFQHFWKCQREKWEIAIFEMGYFYSPLFKTKIGLLRIKVLPLFQIFPF